MNLHFDLDSRNVRNSDRDRNRVQGRVRMGFKVDVDGQFELVGIASTGPNFDSTWATITDTEGGTEGRNIVFRNLYVRKKMGKVTVEGGAMSPVPTVGGAGQAPSGWMDGVRVEVDSKIGKFKVVAGSLGDFDQPNMFKRKFNGNFIELEVEETLIHNIISETAVQNYNGDYYVRQNFEVDLRVLGDRVLTVFAGALYDFKRGGLTAEAGVEVDVLDTLMDKYKGRLNVKLFYSHIDRSMPEREPMLSTFNTFGHQASVHLAGKIDKKGRINWYYRSSIGDRRRQDAGLTLRIPLK